MQNCNDSIVYYMYSIKEVFQWKSDCFNIKADAPGNCGVFSIDLLKLYDTLSIYQEEERNLITLTALKSSWNNKSLSGQMFQSSPPMFEIYLKKKKKRQNIYIFLCTVYDQWAAIYCVARLV